ncbi:hypothetical protein H2248_004004 [Termitomyces sp. 'cryptogamus']|nr:hypothetical protein H2248_004004 [Termitomyces sp. 'cryptogamus']
MEEQKKIVADLASVPNLSRRQVSKIINTMPQFAKPLEPQQISNTLTNTRHEAQEEIAAMGGDFTSILRFLEMMAEDNNWKYEFKADEHGTIDEVWWQSDKQHTVGI